MPFSAGEQVRLISNPGRFGNLTGRTRSRGPYTHWQVRFPDGPSFHPEYELEHLPNEVDEDPIELFRQGKFGRAKDLRSQITHIRLSGRLANLIYSMETTNTDFYPYQFKPVLKFLDSPSNGLLIADEVGLGKTIEAGLIWTELRARVDARRFLVLCPAMLREKWKTELQQRFSIKAEIADAKDVQQHFNKFKRNQEFDYALVCSIQGLRPRKNWEDKEECPDHSSALARFIQENEGDSSFIDLLIIDEAHYIRNPDSQTNLLANLLRKIANHVVLLSATPVNLHSDELFELLKIVDEDTFDRRDMFEYILSANEPLIEIREKILSNHLQQEKFIELVQNALNRPLLKNNCQLAELKNNPPSTEQLHDNQFRSELADRLGRLNLLSNALTRTRKREVTEWRVIRTAVPEEVRLEPQERGFYDKVTNLIRKYAQQKHQPEGFLLIMPQRQIASSIPAALRAWQKRGEELYLKDQLCEDFNNEDAQEIEEIGPLVKEVINNVAYCSDLKTLWELDSKFNRLKEILLRYFEKNPDEKIVLFSYFRPTLYYLQERLQELQISSQVLVGGMKNKEEIINEFKQNTAQKILLASEVASEGIDLQFCRFLINYDLPWNPMKVEQRIGRIDRLGQQSPTITIWNLFYAETIDARIYKRLYERLQIFEKTVGGLEAILGEEIIKLSNDLLFGQLTPEEEERRIEQTAQALENKRLQENQLEESAQNLMAHSDYILNQIVAAKDLQRVINGEDLWIYTRDFFYKYYQGCKFNEIPNKQLTFDIQLSSSAQYELSEFMKEDHLNGQTRLTYNEVQCCFHNKLGGSNSQVETITQFHPLIRFISKKTQTLATSYYPVVSIAINSSYIPELKQKKGKYIFHAQHWSFKGLRNIEKLNIVVKMLNSEFLDDKLAEKLFMLASKYGENWIEVTDEIDLSEATRQIDECDKLSLQHYEDYSKQLKMENDDRANLQVKTLEKHIANQSKKTEETIQKHREEILNLYYSFEIQNNKTKISNRENLIKAERAKFSKVEQRAQAKIEYIEQTKEKFEHFRRDVSIGIIKLD